jgi:hypothetical protein
MSPDELRALGNDIIKNGLTSPIAKGGATFIFEEGAMPTSQSYWDRAATLAVAVLQIIDTAPKQSARRELERYLRDELADLARQAAAGAGALR